jgi:hypothetical protein
MPIEVPMNITVKIVHHWLDPLLINTHTSGLLTYQLLSCQKCV